MSLKIRKYAIMKKMHKYVKQNTIYKLIKILKCINFVTEKNNNILIEFKNNLGVKVNGNIIVNASKKIIVDYEEMHLSPPDKKAFSIEDNNIKIETRG